MFSRAAMTIVGDWVVEQRASAPQDLAGATELFAQISMRTNVAPMLGATSARR
jgi:hypothetical protein